MGHFFTVDSLINSVFENLQLRGLEIHFNVTIVLLSTSILKSLLRSWIHLYCFCEIAINFTGILNIYQHQLLGPFQDFRFYFVSHSSDLKSISKEFDINFANSISISIKCLVFVAIYRVKHAHTRFLRNILKI